jgi:cytochrome c peroxidase
MKNKKIFLLIVLLLTASYLFYSCFSFSKKDAVEANTKLWLNEAIIAFEKIVSDSLLTSIVENKSTNEIQHNFTAARLAYKKIEWAVEYFMPSTAKLVNGPPVDEVEEDENKSFEPEGLQVIEGLIYPIIENENKVELVRFVKILQAKTAQIKIHFAEVLFTKEHVMDAVRLQLYRIIALGISGFDTPLCQSGIEETSASLASLQKVLQIFSSNKEDIKKLDDLINNAILFCKSNSDFTTFDRLSFITNYINPLCAAVLAFQEKNKIAFTDEVRPLKQTAINLFDTNAFDVNSFIANKEYYFTDAKAALGKKIFYSNLLSSNADRSCISCHQPEKAFTDGLKTALSISGMNIKRNSPTLTYAALQHAQFWDMRQPDIEAQVNDVVNNKDEMHGNFVDALNKISTNKSLLTEFKSIYKKDTVQVWQIQNVLASYIRSLSPFNSPFDDYMRGNKAAMDDAAKQGFNIFMGKAKCGTCHYMPIFNGTIPPRFVKTESEIIGVPINENSTIIDTDEGRFTQHTLPSFKHAFKIPTLRNVALTAPYMHNGIHKNLDEVINFYNNGGGVGMKINVTNQTLPSDSLHLSKNEIENLKAFLNTLTDKTISSQAN